MQMTHYMLHEFQQQRQQEDANLAEHQDTQYPQFERDILNYSIFTNSACGQISAKELHDVDHEQHYWQRWAFFYYPDPQLLPQADYKRQLDARLVQLKQQLREQNSPRLIIFTACFLTLVLLMMQGHFLLALLPIAANLWYWARSEQELQTSQQELLQHLDYTQQFEQQNLALEEQLLAIPPSVGLEELQNNYQLAIEHVFRNTLLQQLAPYQIGDLSGVLNEQRWEGFILESWGLLQIPLSAQHDAPIQELLLAEDNSHLYALQLDPHQRQGHTLYRLQYINICVLTPTGLLNGHGYYDRVANHFLHEQYTFYSYEELQHIHSAEEIIPEHIQLKAHLPSTIYQRYFRQPVQILSLSTQNGETVECAQPPVNERPFRQTTWLDQYGLNADIKRLHRRLHERTHASSPRLTLP